MHEPTTVELLDSNGPLQFFNVGTAVRTDSGTLFGIGENHLMVNGHVADTAKVMQLFSDLLTDAGV